MSEGMRASSLWSAVGRRAAGRAGWLVLVVSALLALAQSSAHAQSPLTNLTLDIVGARLVVEPPALVVPKNIATQVNTRLELPAGAPAEALALVEDLAAGSRVVAELRGPGLDPVEVSARPGEPLPVPAFALPGDYFMDRIRLERDGAVLLEGAPSTVPIQVIAEVLVSSVTTRPLSLDEIRARGVVIDESSFSAYNFSLGLRIDGREFRIELPAALPNRSRDQFESERAQRLERLRLINTQLARQAVVELPPDLERPGLNFSIAAVPFFPAGGGDEGGPLFEVPPMAGLVVIPGDVAFLNQVFSVLTTVVNVAPDGSALVVRDVEAEITLPVGGDRVADSGDEPLALARIQGLGTMPVVPVVQPGPDATLGTADDLPDLPPQSTGEAEFLVEGRAEGTHFVDIALRGVLHGLPSGPVEIEGSAAGAVLVRNPTFDITFAHPRTIRAGEPYDLFATLSNTSGVDANLLTVRLPARAISGARLAPGAEESVVFDTIGPGESATARFRLISELTGYVTATRVRTDPGLVAGGVDLTTGVVEREVPAAPDTIVLPATVDALPDALVVAAQRVLGQALSIANAPAGALPDDVLYVSRRVVTTRGVELAEAGQRIAFGDDPHRVLVDLLLDWGGSRVPDAGFDQLLRETEAGAELLAALGAALDAPVGATAADLVAARATEALPRDPVLLAMTSDAAAPAPVALRLVGPDGATSDATTRDLLDTHHVETGAAPGRDLVAVTRVGDRRRFEVEVLGTGTGSFDLAVAVPAATPGEADLLSFIGVPTVAGAVSRLVVDLDAPGVPLLEVDADGDGIAESTAAPAVQRLTEAPPAVVTVRQLESAFYQRAGDVTDPATYGLLVAVLLDKPVDADSVQDLSHWSVEANAVRGAVLQPSGRIAYLYLERPVGALVPRSLTVDGVVDARGVALAPTTRPIEMVLTDGARVYGQVRDADGAPVPNALLDLTIVITPGQYAFPVAIFPTDAEGSFELDFVRRIGTHFVLTAQHPRTLKFATLNARVRGAGDDMALFPTFTGLGVVTGTVRAVDGTVADRAEVRIFSAGLGRGRVTVTDALGTFRFDDVPVGSFGVWAADARGAVGTRSGLVETAGDLVEVDLTTDLPVGQTAALDGRVLLADGRSPAPGFTVYVGSYDRRTDTVTPVAQTVTDADGRFAAEGLRAGPVDVVAQDPASGQIGVTTQVQLVAGTTVGAVVVMEGEATVTGVVFEPDGVTPAVGALVAGGFALATTDALGRFTTAVPPGRRTMEAGNPTTRRRGSAEVTAVAGRTVEVAIRLEQRATVEGFVRDANGQPVPRATVRLVQTGGFSFVFANNQGYFRFPDLQLGDYLFQAPGPSQEALIEWMLLKGIDPVSAFTAGDVPPELGGEPPPVIGQNAVADAYRRSVQRLFDVSQAGLAGPPPSDLTGGFGWTKVRLQQDSVTVVRDIQYLPFGEVEGVVRQANGLPAGAQVVIQGLSVNESGGAVRRLLGRLDTDPTLGTFAFAGIPRFDQQTFQITGIRAGDFTVSAFDLFDGGVVTESGRLDTVTPDRRDLVLQFPSTVANEGTISGCVLAPDGTAPAPIDTEVTIEYQAGITVLTDVDGCFQSLLPIPRSNYRVTARSPDGLRAEGYAQVVGGADTPITLRLLGLGEITVAVVRTDGTPVPGALVRLERGSFPRDVRAGTADAVTGQLLLTGITEGPFSVVAEEPGTGLEARASGIVARDEGRLVVATLQPSGVVDGVFLTAAGAQPIANANVELVSGAVSVYGSTDVDGAFSLPAVPAGPFTVEALDPLTGRKGRAGGEVRFEGDRVRVVLVQQPRGSVTGRVLAGDGVTPVNGARVALSAAGTAVAGGLQAVTLADGSFAFAGVPSGAFALRAFDPLSGFTGTASGTLVDDGEAIARDVVLAPWGSLLVRVLESDGVTPATAARVQITGGNVGRSDATDALGEARFELLPLGSLVVTASSVAVPTDAASARVTLDQALGEVPVDLVLRGVGTVTMTVTDGFGVGVPSARVRLVASGERAGERLADAARTELLGFTDADGIVVFTDVPVGTFEAQVASGPLGGIATGEIAAPNDAVAASVMLERTGTVSGRVLLPGGMTAAVRAFVDLSFASQTGQPGRLQVATGVDGQFDFSGIPFGPVAVDVLEPSTGGVARLAGSIDLASPDLALGDVVLDAQAPRVVAVSPADGASGVALRPTIAITFDEPVLPSTVTPVGVVTLTGPAGPVGRLLAFTDGDATVLVTPSEDLASDTLYTLSIEGAPNGVTDRAGLAMVGRVVSTLRTTDARPPLLVSRSPAPGAVGVLPEAVVRVELDEPIAPGATLTLADDTGQAVAADVGRGLGDSLLVLTPRAFLAPNRTYTATLDGVTDRAGNPLPGLPLTWSFDSVDTQAPVIAAIDVLGTVVGGAPLDLGVQLSDVDVVRVDYLVGDVAAATVTAAPFGATVTLPPGFAPVALGAVAVDAAGNRSTVFRTVVTPRPDLPPTVTLGAVSCPGPTVDAGQVCRFRVQADDDAGLTRISFSAVGAAAFAESRGPDAGGTTFDGTFDLTIPAGAPPGTTVTVQAAAEDTGGATAVAAPLALTVRDGRRPSVSFVSPVQGARVLPGQDLDVVVTASDDAALASLTLACTPALAGCETRPVSGSGPRTETFTVRVPGTAVAPFSVSLVANATDVAGNVSLGASRTVVLADTVAPVATGLVTAGGATRVDPGAMVSVIASATDNVAVTAFDFAVSGATTAAGQVAVAPSPSASGTFVFTVPPTAPDGAALTVTATPRDAAGNAGAPVTLALTVGDGAPPAVTLVAPFDGFVTRPGRVLVVTADATDDVGVRSIDLDVSGAFAFSESRVLAAPAVGTRQSFSVMVPADAAPGPLTVRVVARDGGNASPPASVAGTVIDDVAPRVLITAPSPGTVADPATPFEVVVEVSDNGPLASVTFATSGVVSRLETRPITGDVRTATERFVVTIDAPPPAGGLVSVTALATDVAGNTGAAESPVLVRVADVVAPSVVDVTPADGAVDVAADTTVVVRFSESVDPATVDAASVRLLADGVAVAATLSLDEGRQVLRVDPTTDLDPGASVVVEIAASITDGAGNALAGAVTSAFTVAAPDTTGPRRVTVVPADGATGVAVSGAVTVVLDEAVDPASVRAETFRLLDAVGGPVAGAITLVDPRTARFTPTAPLAFGATYTVELTAGITDLAGNALTDDLGAPLTAPLTSTFTTGTFGIVRPLDGASVVEGTVLQVEADASAGLGVAAVRFLVDGTPVGTDGAAPFVQPVDVPAAAAASFLIVVAEALDDGGAVIATDTVTLAVQPGLRASPDLLGIPLGATGRLTLTLSSPLDTDLPVDVSAVDPSLLGLPVGGVVMPAGTTRLVVPLDGLVEGSTTVAVRSALGDADVIASVSQPVAGLGVDVLARPAGAGVRPPLDAGVVTLPAASSRRIALALLSARASTPVTAIVTSDAPTVANVIGTTEIATGSRVLPLDIATGVDGVARLRIALPDGTWQLTVGVGSGAAPTPAPAAAPAVGISLREPPSLGTLVVPEGAPTTVTLRFLDADASAPVEVAVTSDDPDVVSPRDAVSTVAAGSRSVTVVLQPAGPGFARLSLRAAGRVRAVNVRVGTPGPGELAPVVAPEVGIVLRPPPSLGRIGIASAGTTRIAVTLLPAPVAVPTDVDVTSSDPSVVQAGSPVVTIPAGERAAVVDLVPAADGVAVVTLRAGALVRGLTVRVGPPAPDELPPLVAPPVGVELRHPPSAGSASVGPGTTTRIRVRVLGTPRAVDTVVAITSADPGVASPTSATVVVPAGEVDAVVDLVAGADGTTTVDLDAGELPRRLTVRVGLPAAGTRPPVVAPPVGVELLP
ncbi:MAG: Ig-like domain-containing protein [Ectothiorhodospiraceae bacterium]|nr:Ig-like domain-containing protein [Ectothiorhodospiraceae bacterium]